MARVVRGLAESSTSYLVCYILRIEVCRLYRLYRHVAVWVHISWTGSCMAIRVEAEKVVMACRYLFPFAKRCWQVHVYMQHTGTKHGTLQEIVLWKLVASLCPTCS